MVAVLVSVAAGAVVVPGVAVAQVDAAPVGFFEGCDAVNVAGWTKDPDWAGSLGVHVYKDGPAGVGSFVVAGSASVASEPGTGGANQRFVVAHGQPGGTRLFVHTLGVDAVGGGNGNNPVLPRLSGTTTECVVPGGVDGDENTRPQDGTNCEPAFVVRDYAGVAGSIGMMSAGHCDTKGKAAFGVTEDKDFEIVPLDVNALNAPTVLGGRELVSANYFRAGSLNGDSFTSTDRGSPQVHPTAIGAVGPGVCRYGGVSGAACGSIVRDDYRPSYINDARDFYLLDIRCEKGDSGAAVLSSDGTRAVGIVSGRRRADGACIVSRLDRVFPGMSLYQAPPVDSKYYLMALLDGEWLTIGSAKQTRAKCVEVIAAGERRDIEMRCVPAP